MNGAATASLEPQSPPAQVQGGLRDDAPDAPFREMPPDIFQEQAFQEHAFQEHAFSHARPATHVSKAARIAAAIVRSLDAAAGGRADFGPVNAADLASIARHPSFHAPLNRAFCGLSGLMETPIDIRDLHRLGHSAASNLCLPIVTSDPATVARAAMLLGATILHRHILSRPIRRELEALRTALGNDVYLIATREAPMLYHALADLDDGSFSIAPSIAEDGGRTATRVAATGRLTLRRLLERTEPFLVPVFDARTPSPGEQDEAGIVLPQTVPLTDRHCTHIVRLFHRRFPPWSHIVG